MLRAWRAFDGFRGGDMRPWLLAIVRNCWRSAAGERKRRGHVAMPEERSDMNGEALTFAGPSPEASAIHTDVGRKLDAVIATLPDEFREVLVLREMEDLSYREIASITDSPIGTVMSRLSRARARLEQLLGALAGRE
jgi:RNA polymerase sigma-70 factor (ECF subfamily)